MLLRKYEQDQDITTILYLSKQTKHIHSITAARLYLNAETKLSRKLQICKISFLLYLEVGSIVAGMFEK